MNKKVMAIAIAGALSVPSAVALAQTSTVQIGGSITLFYYQHDPNNSNSNHAAAAGGAGATAGSVIAGATGGQKTDILETSEPEVYIRGEEKLGGGLSAWFQCTSSMDGMVTGAATARGLCGRNSGIGFRGSWGNVFAGNWDMPQKLVFNQARGWWGGTNSFTGGSASLLNAGGASGAQNALQSIGAVVSAVGAVPTATAQLSTVTANNPAEFFRRQASSWNYHSPSWNGFSFQGAFSAANEGVSIPGTSPLDPRMWSLAGQYSSGPFYVGVAYERHQDYNPGNVAIGATAAQYGGGDDDNWTLVAKYTFGSFNIRGIYSKSDYEVTNTTGLDVDGWGLFADWNIQGPHTLRAMYVSVDDASGTSAGSVGPYKGPTSAGCGPASATSCATSTGAKQWGIAYSYAFSKRTMGSLAYVKLDNDINATFSKGKVGATAGNSQSSIGMILQHRF